MTDEQTELYRFTGVKNVGDGTTRIVLEGHPDDPERVAVLGGPPVPMTEQERNDWGDSFQFTKASDQQKQAYEERQQAVAEADAGGVATRQEQMAAQAATSGAQGPSAATSQVNKSESASPQSSPRSSDSDSGGKSGSSKGSQGDKESAGGSSGGTQGNKS
jgi:hypothetical protein